MRRRYSSIPATDSSSDAQQPLLSPQTCSAPMPPVPARAAAPGSPARAAVPGRPCLRSGSHLISAPRGAPPLVRGHAPRRHALGRQRPAGDLHDPPIPLLKGAPSLTVAARKIVRPGRKGRTCAPIPNISNVSMRSQNYIKWILLSINIRQRDTIV